MVIVIVLLALRLRRSERLDIVHLVGGRALQRTRSQASSTQQSGFPKRCFRHRRRRPIRLIVSFCCCCRRVAAEEHLHHHHLFAAGAGVVVLVGRDVGGSFGGLGVGGRRGLRAGLFS
jgi:hypothetical protein